MNFTAEQIKQAFQAASERRVAKWQDTPDMCEDAKAYSMAGFGLLCEALEDLAKQPAPPEGFKRVPRLPSSDQLRAAQRIHPDAELAKSIYLAMVAGHSDGARE